ncbi:hypothetical protein KCP78_14295 [Salmonella enterica subsp. enterica]|nr:hypothetical protein KCP78_14295 [Salmonella enterica subsp. enterica]
MGADGCIIKAIEILLALRAAPQPEKKRLVRRWRWGNTLPDGGFPMGLWTGALDGASVKRSFTTRQSMASRMLFASA